MLCRLLLCENQGGTLDYRSQQPWKSSGIMWMRLPHFYSSGFIENPGSFRIFITTSIELISPLCMIQGKGTMWETLRSSSRPYFIMLFTSGKTPSLKAKLLPYLDMPGASSLIESCTREYRDWTEDGLTPDGEEHSPLEEHFVLLSKDYMPYNNNLGSPFVPPDFTVGLPHLYGTGPIRPGSPFGSWIRRTVLNLPAQSQHSSPVPVPWMRVNGRRKRRRNTVVPRSLRNRSLK